MLIFLMDKRAMSTGNCFFISFASLKNQYILLPLKSGLHYNTLAFLSALCLLIFRVVTKRTFVVRASNRVMHPATRLDISNKTSPSARNKEREDEFGENNW